MNPFSHHSQVLIELTSLITDLPLRVYGHTIEVVTFLDTSTQYHCRTTDLQVTMFRFGGRTVARMFTANCYRSFATESSVELPQAADTAGRYATALYQAARKSDSLDLVALDVTRMQEMQSTISALDEFLGNPSLPRSAKVDALGEIIKRSDFSPTFSQFLMVMAENGRTMEMKKSLQSFQSIMSSLKGKVMCKVTTTEPLTEWEMALLKKRIKGRFFADKSDVELSLETAIDEELLGGLTIQVGDRFMDLSVRTELRKLQDSVSKAIS